MFTTIGRMADFLRVFSGISIDVGALHWWYTKWTNCHPFAVYIFKQPFSIVQCLLSPCQDFNGKIKTIFQSGS